MTMWEDLGKDAVLAMGNAKQATKEGTAELEKVKELNFSDLYSQMAQTFRPVMSGMATELNTLFTENKAVIQEFAQSVADGLLKAFQWIIDNKDSILTWAKRLGTAFLVFKAGGIVGNGIKGISETFKGLSKLSSTLKLDKAFKFLGGKGLSGLKWLGGKGLTGIKTFAKFIGSGFVKSLSLLKAGFLKMIPAIWSAITATWSFTVALLANPITWIVIGVIALIAAIVLLIKNWDKVKEVFSKAWQWFTTTVIEPLKAKFQELGQKISEFFSNAWNWIKSVWSTVTTWFNTTIIQPVLNFFRNLGTSISNAFSTAWNWIKSVWSTVTTWFNTTIIQPVLNFFRNLGTSISNAFSTAWNWIKSVWSTVTAWFNATIIQPVINFFRNLGTSISNAFSTAWNWIKSIWSAVTSWFENTIISPVKQKFTSLKDGIKTAFSSAWTAVKGVWDKAAGWFEDTVVGPIKKGFDKLKEGWDTVKEGFGTAKSKIGGGLKSVGQAIGIPGLASGGVFKANNPFLAVLGDQTRGNNIETPEGLLRQIVREESHGYTPAGLVSNSVSNSKSSESYNYNPVFNISISGSIDNRNTERKIKEIFKKSMDEYAESMMRRNPRLTGV